VLPHSPAFAAGLLPYGDYIIGTPSGIVRGEAGLGELVEDHLARPLRLYVYNHEYDVARLVTITPSRGWGGGGALGCVLGFGALHRLPAPLGEPAQGPGETLFESVGGAGTAVGQGDAPVEVTSTVSQPQGSADNEAASTITATANFLVPADLTSPPPPPFVPAASPFTSAPATGTTTSTGHSRSSARKPRHAAISPNVAFDEYFKEGEQRSKEEDFAPSSTSSALPPPPPPKMGPGTGTGGMQPPGGAGKSASPVPGVDGEGS